MGFSLQVRCPTLRPQSEHAQAGVCSVRSQTRVTAHTGHQVTSLDPFPTSPLLCIVSSITLSRSILASTPRKLAEGPGFHFLSEQWHSLSAQVSSRGSPSGLSCSMQLNKLHQSHTRYRGCGDKLVPCNRETDKLREALQCAR